MNDKLWRLAALLMAATVLDRTSSIASACDAGCMPCGAAIVCGPPREVVPVVWTQPESSWIFKRSTFTHDPETGARVAQFARIEPVEPLDDQRLVTSSYRRMRSENRGRDGSMDTTYVVQGWGDGGGELNAQWQMFNDVWKEAILSGSFYNSNQAIGPWGSGRWGGNGGWGQPGWGGPSWGGPSWGNPGWGNPGWGGPGWGPGWQNPGRPGGGWNRGSGADYRSRGHWPSDDRMPLPVPN